MSELHFGDRRHGERFVVEKHRSHSFQLLLAAKPMKKNFFKGIFASLSCFMNHKRDGCPRYRVVSSISFSLPSLPWHRQSVSQSYSEGSPADLYLTNGLRFFNHLWPISFITRKASKSISAKKARSACTRLIKKIFSSLLPTRCSVGGAMPTSKERIRRAPPVRRVYRHGSISIHVSSLSLSLPLSHDFFLPLATK